MLPAQARDQRIAMILARAEALNQESKKLRVDNYDNLVREANERKSEELRELKRLELMRLSQESRMRNSIQTVSVPVFRPPGPQNKPGWNSCPVLNPPQRSPVEKGRAYGMKASEAQLQLLAKTKSARTSTG